MARSREEELIAEIEDAFAGVRLEDGVSLNMTEYYDSGGSASHYAEESKTDERDDWHRLDDKTLEDFRVVFSFTDVKGFRFYIAPYMIWALRNHRISDAIIGDFTIYAIRPDHHVFEEIPFTSWFTGPQIAVMARFLEYCCDHDDTMDGTVAAENLAKLRDSLREE
jgi:hypothetical protein